MLLIAGGVAIVIAHNEFVELVVILIGLYVAYAGVAELMRLTISETGSRRQSASAGAPP